MLTSSVTKQHGSTLLFLSMCVLSWATVINSATSPESVLSDGVMWYDVESMGNMQGKGYNDTSTYYTRLPGSAEAIVPSPVWADSLCSAGLRFDFQTNSTSIWISYNLTSPSLDMPHMPATGVSGVDLYARNNSNPNDVGEGPWRFVASAHNIMPGQGPTTQNTSGVFVSGLSGVERQFRIYLPLYNGVSTMSVGVYPTSTFVPLSGPVGNATHPLLPVVYWGTSILQGGVASRPAMAYTAMTGRWLGDYPFINLGFSGYGRMQTTVTPYIAQNNASAFIIQCLPNMNASSVSTHTIPMVNTLRAVHPHTPIVLAEGHIIADEWILEGTRQAMEQEREALRTCYEKLIHSGVSELYYVYGDELLGDDGDDTVDTLHLSDLGMYRQGSFWTQFLRGLLGV
eukprot:TRINITY_DN9032_c0_g1_i1.p1 TRINITY_DN9032_c0_g1~~TRINITY_DN9032_c0_g1_i1.p1  ORF type:complete len:433 (+),score=36.70 TRINITY_DN9032_c0_g1_i1:104-1300(+)